MRGVRFAKVEGHDSLVRDMNSNAIISTSDLDYQAYKKRRELEKRQKTLMDEQVKEIANLKADMQEIKRMLGSIIKGQ